MQLKIWGDKAFVVEAANCGNQVNTGGVLLNLLSKAFPDFIWLLIYLFFIGVWNTVQAFCNVLHFIKVLLECFYFKGVLPEFIFDLLLVWSTLFNTLRQEMYKDDWLLTMSSNLLPILFCTVCPDQETCINYFLLFPFSGFQMSGWMTDSYLPSDKVADEVFCCTGPDKVTVSRAPAGPNPHSTALCGDFCSTMWSP